MGSEPRRVRGSYEKRHRNIIFCAFLDAFPAIAGIKITVCLFDFFSRNKLLNSLYWEIDRDITVYIHRS